MKSCSVCRLQKPLDSFDGRKASPDGLSYKCKPCAAAYRAGRKERYRQLRRAHYERNVEAEKTAALTYYRANRDARMRAHAEYMVANAERMAQYRRDSASDCNARTAKRRAALLRRTPAWLTEDDFEAMHAKYVEAARLRAATGLSFHVDHEIPLQGENVCGLHVPSNLRVLYAPVNLSKGNRFDPAAATA